MEIKEKAHDEFENEKEWTKAIEGFLLAVEECANHGRGVRALN